MARWIAPSSGKTPPPQAGRNELEAANLGEKSRIGKGYRGPSRARFGIGVVEAQGWRSRFLSF